MDLGGDYIISAACNFLNPTQSFSRALGGASTTPFADQWMTAFPSATKRRMRRFGPLHVQSTVWIFISVYLSGPKLDFTSIACLS
jgi:hypothetical protein